MFSYRLKSNVWIVVLALVSGIFLGWIIFGSATEQSQSTEEKSGHDVYTCSMHPQVRQREPGKCPLCGMSLTPLLEGSKKSDPFIYEMSKEAVALANVQTKKIDGTVYEGDIYLSGKIQYDEQSWVTIPAYFPGRIEKLFVNYTGMEVRKGERLATIYSPELVTAQKELLEAEKMKHLNQTLYESAKEKLKLWNISESQIDAIEKGEVLKSNFDIYATKSGIVTKRLVSEGDYIERGQALFELSDLSKVWVVLDAYEIDLSSVHKGSELRFSVNVDPGKEYTASVTYIDPFINPETRSAKVRAEVDNRKGLLKPDMYVKAKIRSENTSNRLLIPKTALLWTGKRSIVYVKIPESKTPAFEMREIVLGGTFEDNYQVDSGLVIGEEIVVNGVFFVDAAAQLQGGYSMMNAAPVKRIQVPEVFKLRLTELMENYFILTKALVESDTIMARESSLNLEKEVLKIETELLNEKAKKTWTDIKNAIVKAGKGISESADISQQRVSLGALSDQMIEVVEIFGLTKNKVYKAYCPMALDDKGAYWLSNMDYIYNPYFGEKMLQCGEILKVYGVGLTREKMKGRPVMNNHSH